MIFRLTARVIGLAQVSQRDHQMSLLAHLLLLPRTSRSLSDVVRFESVLHLNYYTPIDRILRPIRIHTPRFSAMKAGDSVLDVCCGTGDQAVHYATRGIIAAGIDLHPQMIAVAEKKRRKRGLENASFQRGDAENLPFKDSSFDCATICLALHEKESGARDKVVSEMRRVVREEGTLVFIDYAVPQPRGVFACSARVVESIAGRDHFRCFKEYIDEGGLDELLRRNYLRQERRGLILRDTIVMVATRNV